MTSTPSRSHFQLPGIINRRTALKGAAALSLAGSAGLPFSRLSFAQDAPAELKEGGTLRAAILGDPTAGLDAQYTTAVLTGNVAQHVFEGLFANDASFAAQPMLVSDYEMSADGLTLSCSLRSGVTFHNGKELSSEDVVASLNRWGTLSSSGRLAWGRLDSIEAPDAQTVVLTFNQPTGIITSLLASISAFIMPAEIAEATGEDQLANTDWIGTGPYTFVEHAPDQYIRMARNDDYVSREEDPDGAAGRKTPYLDGIELLPVPDQSVRANGLLTGEYHWSDTVPPDFYDMLNDDPSVEALIVKPYQLTAAHFNKAQGVFMEPAMRHAVQLSFSQSLAMLAGFGREEFVRADASISGLETVWHSTAGADAYDNPDPDRVQELLAEAGYNGEPIRWLANNQYPYNALLADYVKQQAEPQGINIEVIVTDWPTYSEMRADPEAWEIFATGHTSASHPASMTFNDPEWPGFWDSEPKDAAVSAMIEAPDDAALKDAVDSYTQIFYDEMPAIKMGDQFELRAHRAEVKGYQNNPAWAFWNVGLDD
jgi:peptide/nickel transport system substrate-binding protein